MLLTILVLVFLNPLCSVFGATDNIMPYALEYGRIIACGFPFVIVAVIINGVIRADGSPNFSMVSMMMGAILNMFLDQLFIFVFKMGVSGAALATVISQFINLVLNVAYLFRFKNIKLKPGYVLCVAKLMGQPITLITLLNYLNIGGGIKKAKLIVLLNFSGKRIGLIVRSADIISVGIKDVNENGYLGMKTVSLEGIQYIVLDSKKLMPVLDT